jgi:hypothetical protein
VPRLTGQAQIYWSLYKAYKCGVSINAITLEESGKWECVVKQYYYPPYDVINKTFEVEVVPKPTYIHATNNHDDDNHSKIRSDDDRSTPKPQL